MSLLGTRAGREGRRAKGGRMERPLPPWEVRGGMAVTFKVLVICLRRWFWNSGNNFMLWKKGGRGGKKNNQRKSLLLNLKMPDFFYIKSFKKKSSVAF